MRELDGPVGLSGLSDSAYAQEILRFLGARRAQITERFRDVLLQLLQIARDREALSARHSQLLENLNRLRLRLRAAMRCDDDDDPPAGAVPAAGTCTSLSPASAAPGVEESVVDAADRIASRALDRLSQVPAIPPGTSDTDAARIRNEALLDYYASHGEYARHRGSEEGMSAGVALGVVSIGWGLRNLWQIGRAVAADLASSSSGEAIGGGLPATAGMPGLMSPPSGGGLNGVPGLSPVPEAPSRPSGGRRDARKPVGPASGFGCRYVGSVPLVQRGGASAPVTISGGVVTAFSQCYIPSRKMDPKDFSVLITARKIVSTRQLASEIGGRQTLSFPNPVALFSFVPVSATGRGASASTSGGVNREARLARLRPPPAPVTDEPSGGTGLYRQVPVVVAVDAVFEEQPHPPLTIGLSEMIMQLNIDYPSKVQLRLTSGYTLKVPGFQDIQLSAHSC